MIAGYRRAKVLPAAAQGAAEASDEIRPTSS